MWEKDNRKLERRVSWQRSLCGICHFWEGARSLTTDKQSKYYETQHYWENWILLKLAHFRNDLGAILKMAFLCLSLFSLCCFQEQGECNDVPSDEVHFCFFSYLPCARKKSLLSFQCGWIFVSSINIQWSMMAPLLLNTELIQRLLIQTYKHSCLFCCRNSLFF